MERVPWRVVGGVLLVLVGALLLLQQLNIFTFVWDLAWTVLFLAGSFVFLSLYVGRPDNWWAAIPGMALLGLGAVIGLSILGLDNVLGGSVFLGALALGFGLVYLRDRRHWWAVIPGGVLLTLALVAGIDQIFPAVETGGLFFLGLALTFLLVYLVPVSGERMTWALIPAAVLFVIGVIVTMATSSLLRLVWPAVLIVVGLYLVYRAFWARR